MEELLHEFLTPELIILIPTMWVLGYIIKHSKINSAYIPFIILAITILFSMVMLKDVVDGVIQGILISGITILGHQLVTQAENLKE